MVYRVLWNSYIWFSTLLLMFVFHLFQPARVHLCDGSDAEFKELTSHMVKTTYLPNFM